MMKRIKDLCNGCKRFLNSHGFSLVVTLCIAVITMSAVWTKRTPAPAPLATQPSGDGVNAASLWQEGLSSVTPTALPTPSVPIWCSPLDAFDVVQPFSDTQMTCNGGIWQVHAAVDLAAPAGAPVMAMADGRVTGCGESDFDGTWIEITHGDNAITRYAGLSLLGAYRTGDAVHAGQTIGFVGNSHAAETHLPPHLHLQFFQDGQAADPLTRIP